MAQFPSYYRDITGKVHYGSDFHREYSRMDKETFRHFEIEHQEIADVRKELREEINWIRKDLKELRNQIKQLEDQLKDLNKI